MPVALPPAAERSVLELARLPEHEWVEAARADAGARRSLMFAEARASLHLVLEAAREEPVDTAVAAEIIRRIEEAVRAVRPLVRRPAAGRAVRQSAMAAAPAYAFRERLTPAEMALLVAPYRATLERPEDPAG